MDRLYSVKDICERYQVKSVTARKIMRDMEHLEKPLMVSERAVRAWELRKTLPPESVTRQMLKKGGAKSA
jgi:DeoR/GlpR family transcriptional regulator of sugar metabolism